MSPTRQHASSTPADRRQPATIAGQLRRIGLPTRILLVVATALTLIGTAGTLFGRSTPTVESPASHSSNQSALQSVDQTFPVDNSRSAMPRLGLDARDASPADDDAEAGPQLPSEQGVSPIARGLGISFLAAFAVGVASRVFLRVALAALGVAVLLLLGLERCGIVDIHWSLLDGSSGGITAGTMNWIATQTESFQAFVTGALPSTAAAATGFFLGFRRR